MKKLLLILGCFAAILSTVSCTTEDLVKSDTLNEKSSTVEAVDSPDTILIYLGDGNKDTSHG